MKLHTAKLRKFLQIVVTGLTTQLFQLTDPQLIASTSIDINFRSMNPTGGQKLTIGNDMNVSYMWEMELGKDEKSAIPIKTDFIVKYNPVNIDELEEEIEDKNDDPLHSGKLNEPSNEEIGNIYRCNFELTNYVV